MQADIVKLDIEDRIGIITLNRPAVHNVVDAAVMTRLESILDQVEASTAIRALILTGAGERTFSAGGDLKYFATLETREAGLEMSQRMQAILARLYEGKRVVIAAVNGQALGGGCEILTACHFRIAADTARFGFRQAANGLITGWGGGTRLFSLIGRSRALDLLLTSRVVDAGEALEMALIDRVVPSGEVMAAARELAERVCANPELAVSTFLELARSIERDDHRTARRRETELFADCWTSEGFRSVLQKFNKNDKKLAETD